MWRLPKSVMLPKGWRRTAAVNTALAGGVSVVLAGLLIWSATVAGSVERGLVFYHGSCKTSSAVNLVIHLFINIASTCVMSSSNFFMQVLHSPTRNDVERAHSQLRELDIGVPSTRNIGHVSRFKTFLWLLFVLTSAPIHVLFNSAVFETDYQGAGFFMAMATDAFVSGHGEYHGPGASLVNPGAPRDLDGSSFDYQWGAFIDMTQFLNESSDAMQNLSSTSKLAQSWTRLDAHDCRAQYGTCTPRHDYGNVVLAVEPRFRTTSAAQQNEVTGFVVDDIFNMTSAGVPWDPKNYTTDELRAYWNRYGPIDQPNPLWFSSWCRIYSWVDAGECIHTCSAAVGLSAGGGYVEPYWLASTLSDTTTSWEVVLSNYTATSDHPDYHETSGVVTLIAERPTFNTSTVQPGSSLEITHCYAQPLHLTCKTALSNSLLLTVTICVIFKTALCVITWLVLRDEPLVTLGDAMASFISRPDPTTEGRALTGLSHPVTEQPYARPDEPTIGREWKPKPVRIAAAIPRGVWVRTYGPILVVLIATMVFLGMASQVTTVSKDTDAFNQNQNTNLAGLSTLQNTSFLGKVLLANMPQLVLSLCYFALNALITRGCTEIEWNSYSLSYKPLRVSYPQKGQTSTYRLQLPYRYSISLMAALSLLHWLVSNAFYISIIDGDYLSDQAVQLPGISDNAHVNLGFSSRVILIVLLVAMAITAFPLVFCRRLKGNMATLANSSAVLSASCHASTVGIRKRSPAVVSDGDGSAEKKPLLVLDSPSDDDAKHATQVVEGGRIEPPGTGKTSSEAGVIASTEKGEISRSEALLLVSRSPVRWGVVRMPPEWYAEFGGDSVEHLAFGTKEQAVGDPQVGRYYA